MKTKNKKYSEVVKLYPDFSDSHIADLLGLTVQTVRGIGVDAGLKKNSFYWTPEEDAIVLKYYPEYGWQDVEDRLRRLAEDAGSVYRRNKNSIVIRYNKIK